MAGKADIVAQVATEAGLTKTAAAAAVDSVIGTIAELAKNERVTLKGFGTFSTKTTAARVGRNPQTGGTVDIPAKTSLKFKAAKG